MAKSFTVPQVLTAIRNSGGVMSAIAHSLECDWHTADDFIDKHPTLVQAVKDEKHQITDKAKYNVVKAINDGDLQLSKWWLQVMDEEFIEKQRHELTGAEGGKIHIDVTVDGD